MCSKYQYLEIRVQSVPDSYAQHLLNIFAQRLKSRGHPQGIVIFVAFGLDKQVIQPITDRCKSFWLSACSCCDCPKLDGECTPFLGTIYLNTDPFTPYLTPIPLYPRILLPHTHTHNHPNIPS